MQSIKKLEDLVLAVKKNPSMTLAVAAGEDPATIEAIAKCVEDDLLRVILIGSAEKVEAIAKSHSAEFAGEVEIMHSVDEKDAAQKAVQLVHDGKAGLLMKGLVSTATFMKAILDKEMGLVPPGGLLTHVAVMEVPSYPKLLIVSDAGIIPNPTMDEKVTILKHTIELAHQLGNANPKAALISAAEKINFRMQSSIDAAVIKAMAERKQILGAIVDGPLALDVSLSPEHCAIKGLESPIDGQADILIFPNIETANTFYKSVTLLAHGKSASIVMGSSAPIVLSSRADDDDTKFYSIVLAAHLASQRSQSGDAPLD
jgi:phosphate butyryltransferase